MLINFFCMKYINILLYNIIQYFVIALAVWLKMQNPFFANLISILTDIIFA